MPTGTIQPRDNQTVKVDPVRDAECSVLAAMLLGADAIERARALLRPEDFYLVSHQRVFAAFLALPDRGDPATFHTLTAELRQRGHLEAVGGPAGLTEIANYVATSANVEAHARLVLAAAQKRRIRQIGLELVERAEDPMTTASGALAQARANLEGVAGSVTGDGDRFTAAAVDASTLVRSQIERPRSLLGDGLLTAGGFGVMYGVPGIGKTWQALALARALVRGTPWLEIPTHAAGCRVGMLQLELPDWYLQERLRALRISDDERDANLHFVCRPTLRGAVDLFHDEQEVTRLRRWIEHAGLDLLAIDALSRAHTADENTATDMGTVLARLDALRHDTGCALLAVHHERKAQNGGDSSDLDALRGSSRLQSDPTALIRVKRVGGLRCITFPKVSFGPTPTDVHFRVGEDGVPLVVEGPESVADGNRRRILDFVLAAGGPVKRAEVEEGTGLKASACKDHLRALVDAGSIQLVGEGRCAMYAAPAVSAGPAAPASTADPSALHLKELPYEVGESAAAAPPPSAISAGPAAPLGDGGRPAANPRPGGAPEQDDAAAIPPGPMRDFLEAEIGGRQ